MLKRSKFISVFPQLDVVDEVPNTLVYSPLEEAILDAGHEVDEIPNAVVAAWEKQYTTLTYPAIYDELKMEARFVYTLVPIALKRAQSAYRGGILKRLYRELSD